jgi:hypothetical protein
MKAHRIYGVKNKQPFCQFPKGDNVMANIKVQCYMDKNIKSFHGKDFKCVGLKKWTFHIGDIVCYVIEYKPCKFKVEDKDNVLFKNNQLAGMFYMHTIVSSTTDTQKLFLEYVDDEITRLQDCKVPPYREPDSFLMTIIRKSTFKSPVTKQSARNRELITFLCDKKNALQRYEIYARNQIVLMNCNSWFNRFGKEYVMKNYIVSTPFFEKLFEFVNQYFFASTLTDMAVWTFDRQTTQNTNVVQMTVNKEKIKEKVDVKYIIRTFQKDMVHIIGNFLQASKSDTKTIMRHLFGFKLTKASGILTHKIIEVPPKEYQQLYSKPSIMFMT